MGLASSRRANHKSLKLPKGNNAGKNDSKSGFVKDQNNGRHLDGKLEGSDNSDSQTVAAKQRRVSRVKAWENSPGRGSFRSAENNCQTTNNNVKMDGKSDDTVVHSSVAAEAVPPSPLPGQTSVFDSSNVITVYELYNFLCEGSATPHIYDPTYMLLIDSRAPSSFAESHIVLARSSSNLYPNLLRSNLDGYAVTEGEIGDILRKFALVVVYGDKVHDLEDCSCTEVKLLTELASRGVEPVLLSAGFETFSRTFPFLCTTQEFRTDRDLKKVLVHPSVILTDQLYLGRGDQATNPKIIDNLNITHVVNISREHPNAFPDRLKYLTIKLDDVSQSNLKHHFAKANQFIEDALCKDGSILVHCNMGVSRSSTITIAYLMKRRQWTLKTAHDFVKEKRACISPNRGFLFQLLEWEETLFGKKQTDIDDLWF